MLWEGLEGIGEHPGGLPEAFGGIWEALGASWAAFGNILAPLGPPQGASTEEARVKSYSPGPN